MYTPNIEASKYINQILTNIKEEIDSNDNSRGIWYPTYINGQVTETENQYVNTGLKGHIRPDELNR